MSVEDILGHRGRIFGSKGQYRWDHAKHVVVFNANVCTSQGKVWHGDLDITVDEEKLMRLAQELKERIYVLYETDARFENEKSPKLDRAVYSVEPSGQDHWNEEYFVRSENGRLYEQDMPAPSPEDKEDARQKYLSGLDEQNYERTSVKIPWSKINRLNAKTSPLHKFWSEISQSFGLPLVKKDEEQSKENQEFYKRVLVSHADHEKLKEAMSKWIDKYHDYLSDYRKNSELTWAIFLSGPDYLLHDPHWIERGFVYLTKPKEDEP